MGDPTMLGDLAVARLSPFRQRQQHLDRLALVGVGALEAVAGVGRGGGLDRVGPVTRADAGVELRIAEASGGLASMPAVD